MNSLQKKLLNLIINILAVNTACELPKKRDQFTQSFFIFLQADAVHAQYSVPALTAQLTGGLLENPVRETG